MLSALFLAFGSLRSLESLRDIRLGRGAIPSSLGPLLGLALLHTDLLPVVLSSLLWLSFRAAVAANLAALTAFLANVPLRPACILVAAASLDGKAASAGGGTSTTTAMLVRPSAELRRERRGGLSLVGLSSATMMRISSTLLEFEMRGGAGATAGETSIMSCWPGHLVASLHVTRGHVSL